MEYIKIHPFDFFRLLLGVDVIEVRQTSDNVKVSLSGPGFSEPYSYDVPLIEFRGKKYLRVTTVPPSEEALAIFEAERPSIEKSIAEAASRPPVVVTYDPESEETISR